MKILNDFNPVALKSIIGNNVTTNAQFAKTQDDSFYFIAGASVRQYSLSSLKQRVLIGDSGRQLTCLSVSQDGKYIITGEAGHMPNAKLYSSDDFSLKCSFSGHKFRINCVEFNPKGNFIVTIGSPEDQSVFLWNRLNYKKVASSKTCSMVNSVAFSSMLDYFVTVGSRVIKFWYLKQISKKKNEEIPIESRNVILSENLYNNFIDLVIVKEAKDLETIYALSTNSSILKIDSKRQILATIKLNETLSKCMTLYEDVLMIGNSQKLITLIDRNSLEKIGCLELKSEPNQDSYSSHVNDEKSDIVALEFMPFSNSLIAFFYDFSFEVWNLTNVNNNEEDVKISKVYEEVSHADIIWDIVPISSEVIRHVCINYSEKGVVLFDNTLTVDELKEAFFTCSEDGKIILWKIIDPLKDSQEHENRLENGLPMMPKSESRIIHVLNARSVFERFLSVRNSPVGEEEGRMRQKLLSSINFGLKCLSLSFDCLHLAVGNKSGELLIFSASQKDTLLYFINAHDSEITCMDYFSSEINQDIHMLCTGGRDRLIRLWNVKYNYQPMYTINDHSGAILFMKIIETLPDAGMTGSRINLVSCSSDKSIIFRSLNDATDHETSKFQIYSQVMSKSSQSSATVLPKSDNLYVVCQDRKIRVYSIEKGRLLCTMKGNQFRDGSMGCCCANFDGESLAITNSDKKTSIICPLSGTVFSIISGHSESITSMAFLQTRRHLITTSCDHTIFIWQLPEQLQTVSRSALGYYRGSQSSICQLLNSDSQVDDISEANYIENDFKGLRKSVYAFNQVQPSERNIKILPMIIETIYRNITPRQSLNLRIKKSSEAKKSIEKNCTKISTTNHSTPTNHHRSISVPSKMIDRYTSAEYLSPKPPKPIIVEGSAYEESDVEFTDPSSFSSQIYEDDSFVDFGYLPNWVKEKSVQSLNNIDLQFENEVSSHQNGNAPIKHQSDVVKHQKRLTTSLYEPIDQLRVQMTSSSSGIGNSNSPSIKNFKVNKPLEDRRTLTPADARNQVTKRTNRYQEERRRSEDHSETSSIASSSKGSRVRACWSKSMNFDVSIKPESARRNSSIGKYMTLSPHPQKYRACLLDDEKDSSSSTITSIKEASRLSDNSRLDHPVRRPTVICNFFSKLALELDKINSHLETSKWSIVELDELQRSYSLELEPRLEKLQQKLGVANTPLEDVAASRQQQMSHQDREKFEYVQQVMDTILPKMQDLQLFLRTSSVYNVDSDPPTISSDLVCDPLKVKRIKEEKIKKNSTKI